MGKTLSNKVSSILVFMFANACSAVRVKIYLNIIDNNR